MTKIRSNQYNDFAQVDQPVPNAVELGGIDSGNLDLPDTGNKALFLDQVDNEVKTIDPNGVIETLGGGGGGGGGLGLEFIDETTVFPYTLIKDRGTRCDFSQVVGPTEIELILPEGTGAETFRCGITITSLPEDVTVKISTSNAQTILLPDGSTTEFIENINAATEFVIAWDQSQYNYGDDWAPNYANFTGNVPFDEITVNQINGGEATATQAGTVKSVYYSGISGASQAVTGTITKALQVAKKEIGITLDQNLGDTLTVLHDGDYQILAQLSFSGFTTGEAARIEIHANDVRIGTHIVPAGDGSGNASGTAIAFAENLLAGQEIFIGIIMAGGNANTLVSRPDYSQIIVRKCDA